MMREVVVKHKAIIVIISESYEDAKEKYGHVSDKVLYEITRRAWKVDPQRANRVEYVLASCRRIVQEVYRVRKPWRLAQSSGDPNATVSLSERYEFEGTVAEEEVRNFYKGKRTKFRSYGVEYKFFNC